MRLKSLMNTPEKYRTLSRPFHWPTSSKIICSKFRKSVDIYKIIMWGIDKSTILDYDGYSLIANRRPSRGWLFGKSAINMNASSIITTRFNTCATWFQYPKASQQYGKLINKALISLLSRVYTINASSKKLQYLAPTKLLHGQSRPSLPLEFNSEENEAPKM